MSGHLNSSLFELLAKQEKRRSVGGQVSVTSNEEQHL